MVVLRTVFPLHLVASAGRTSPPTFRVRSSMSGGMRAARAARQDGSGDGSGEAVSAEVVLTPSREYLESKEMLSVVQQALEALSRECARRGSQQDPRHRVNAIDWLATWLMRNNPSHNAETRAKLAARKNNPKFAIGAGIRGGSEVPAGGADAGAVVGAGDGPSTLVKITLNDGGRARVAIQHELPESGGKGMARRMRPRHGDGNGEEDPIERKLRLGHLLSADEVEEQKRRTAREEEAEKADGTS